jgi:hypothetical protein
MISNLGSAEALSCAALRWVLALFEMEEKMRRIILAAAATLAVLVAGSLAPGRANAMTVSTPAGIAAAVDATSLAQDVAYVCRRVWRCGPYGCGWRRSCFYTGGPGYYGRRGYYGRGYYGRGYYGGRGYYRRY